VVGGQACDSATTEAVSGIASVRDEDTNHSSKDIDSIAAIYAGAATGHVDVHHSRTTNAAAAGATVATTENDNVQRIAMMYVRESSFTAATVTAARSDINSPIKSIKESAMIPTPTARDDKNI
jgi:hypothetical protein